MRSGTGFRWQLFGCDTVCAAVPRSAEATIPFEIVCAFPRDRLQGVEFSIHSFAARLS
jgi:hypothetical protein